MFTVALCQYEYAGVATAEDLCTRAEELFEAAGPADLYVLPELFATDFTATETEEERLLTGDALTTVERFVTSQASARDALVVGGSYRTHEDDAIVNRTPIGRPDGSLTTYTKRHPTPEERERGTRRGTAPPPVVEHAGTTVGVIICYDVEFPAAVAAVADAGAEVLAVPSLTATEAGFQRVSRCSAARAVENQLYVAHVPLVGSHPHPEKAGTGRGAVYGPCDDVVGPDGTGLTLPRDEHCAATQSLDIERLRDSRAEASVRPYTDRSYFES
jgi:predicted amidohydrolase